MFQKENWWSVKCLAIFSRMLSCHRPSCRARCAKNNNLPPNNPNFLLVIRFARKPSRFLLSLCGRLFLPLRSFLGDDVRLYHSIVNILTNLFTIFGTVFVNCLRLLRFQKESLWTRHCFRCILCLHRIILNPIREIILHDWSAMQYIYQLVYSVQNVVICRDHVSEFWKTRNPIHALLWFHSTPGSCCVVFLGASQSGSFGYWVKHILVFSELGTDDTFLTLGIFFQHFSSRIGGNRKKLLIKNFSSTTSCVRPTIATDGESFTKCIHGWTPNSLM